MVPIARCGCSGQSCSCAVTGGAGVTVTGRGSFTDPYIVSSDGIANITVADSATIDLSLTGSGTAEDPYVISGSTIGGLAAHASTHENGGSDEVALDASQIVSGTIATARLGSGSANSTKFLRGDQSWATANGGPELRETYERRTGALYETTPRLYTTAGSSTGLTSGVLRLTAIVLPANLVISNIAFARDAGATSPTNWWFGLYDENLVQLALTADQTTTAWGATTEKVLPIATTAAGAASTFTTTYEGLYYLGIMVKATGTGSIPAAAFHSALVDYAPILARASDSAQTTPPAFPHTATAGTAASTALYGYVS